MSFDVSGVRKQFPILSRSIDDNPLIYLDNAATTQKPQAVIDALVKYYSETNSNVHRGAHRLADEATQEYEAARDTVASFINAESREEVIWTSGTTESINIIAHGIVDQLTAGDEIVITEMEHHANLVPWQQACKKTGAILKVAPILETGELDLEAFGSLLNESTRLVAFPHVSNALGTVNPIEKMTAMAKAYGALVVVDGAQGIAHGGVDVRAIGCDFYAFSGHKIFGPTGTGVLWGRQSLLNNWPVWKTGGEMIQTVTYESAQWNVLPYRLEAGTPHISGAIGLAAALKWFSSMDLNGLKAHEASLMSYATERANHFQGLRTIGTAPEKTGVLSFVMDSGHPADVGFLLDRQGVAIRTGHHCAEPLMNRLGVPGTARASFSIYNTLDEIDGFFEALEKVRFMLD